MRRGGKMDNKESLCLSCKHSLITKHSNKYGIETFIQCLYNKSEVVSINDCDRTNVIECSKYKKEGDESDLFVGR